MNCTRNHQAREFLAYSTSTKQMIMHSGKQKPSIILNVRERERERHTPIWDQGLHSLHKFDCLVEPTAASTCSLWLSEISQEHNRSHSLLHSPSHLQCPTVLPTAISPHSSLALLWNGSFQKHFLISSLMDTYCNPSRTRVSCTPPTCKKMLDCWIAAARNL